MCSSNMMDKMGNAAHICSCASLGFGETYMFEPEIRFHDGAALLFLPIGSSFQGA